MQWPTDLAYHFLRSLKQSSASVLTAYDALVSV